RRPVPGLPRLVRDVPNRPRDRAARNAGTVEDGAPADPRPHPVRARVRARAGAADRLPPRLVLRARDRPLPEGLPQLLGVLPALSGPDLRVLALPHRSLAEPRRRRRAAGAS